MAIITSLSWLIFSLQVTTVDKFQGQQNDFILLSLVRTRFVGHLRDVRRLVVAMSRARLGLYVFCRRSLFEQCYELQPTFQLLLQRPDHLALNLNETTSFTDRHVADPGLVQLVSGVEEMSGIVNFKMHQVYQVCLSWLLGYCIILEFVHIGSKLCLKVPPVSRIKCSLAFLVGCSMLKITFHFGAEI